MSTKNPGKWRKVYRINLTDDEEHKILRTFKTNMLWSLIVLITAVVIIIVCAYLIIAHTPIRTTIPGYPDAYSRQAALTNALKIDSLENMMMRWELYAGNLSKVLSGEQAVSLDSLVGGSGSRLISGKSADELRSRDSLLRETVREEEQFKLSEAERTVPIEGKLFFTPVKGIVTNGFEIVLHPGVDVMAPENSVVCAALDGSIISAMWTDVDGYSILLQHQGDMVTLYKHCQKLLHKVGDKVSAGTPIALTGGTAAVGADNHLHFEIWYRGESVDPAKYISF